ncbi:NAD(P)/FAD-dependent oxidoreductase [Nitrosomonas sp.]|uniref:NAD(P)/FAD-dependent oxidoreductase n=1 Tax=Nitrosomonas sp. TaxID=42353 RepID=UPI001D6CB55F|nr:FAD-dependent oxidoreductase [Nitrosomonas sp.]MBX3616479.1 FAD-dependent oxidoreductase [Nitrosomonas sp.]
MVFLPFSFTQQKKIKVVIVGGGYAGLAALTNLLQFAPDTDITIIDPRSYHIKMTHLHETFRYPLSDLLVPFETIEKRYGCRHIQASFQIDSEALRICQDNKRLVVNDEMVDFDYLIIASGCESKAIDSAGASNILTLSNFTTVSGSDLLPNRLSDYDQPVPSISVVGGGATGIQFLFEIQQFLLRINKRAKLSLIHSGNHVLEQFPAGFGTYVESRMDDMDIAFYPNIYYCEQQVDQVLLIDKETKAQKMLPSDLAILFLGKKQQHTLSANAFGQILVDQKPLHNIFTAGDCSHYQSLGSNTLTAQSAVRKGKLVARNILRHAGIPGLLEPYLHHELGYVVSLGASDAVGWLVAESNMITGMPALTIKELVEAQYDLLLAGIDTYVV